jgi:hypothetical protein
MIVRHANQRRSTAAAMSAVPAFARRKTVVKPQLTVVAIPEWEGRVSPLFDVAGRLVIVEIAAARMASCRRQAMLPQRPDERAETLAEWRVEKLLCGGISRVFSEALERKGVTVIPHLSGCIQGILQAYLDQQLADRRFSMPGCRACCQWCRARRGKH